MIEILETFEFGFVFEIQNNHPYNVPNDFEIFLNGEFKLKTNTNVIGFYDLKPDVTYEVSIKKLISETVTFNVTTLKPNYVINIKDFNAAGDGVCDDTSAINLAIYQAPDGALIYFPKGTYLVDQILLKSNLNFYLDKETTIIQNTTRDKMGILSGLQKNYDHTENYLNTTWEGNPLSSYCPLIYAKDICNVKIYGFGTLNGNGENSGFWINPKAIRDNYRPKNVEFVNCDNISVCGIKSLNSSCWNIHTLFSTNINFYDLHIESVDTSPNTDGINPESSENVNIIGCTFNVGDDCVAIKSGKYYLSQYFYKPSSNINIRNCLMKKGHGGVVIGSEIASGCENVQISNCIFSETDRGIRIKTRRGRGIKSVVSGINVYNCEMDRVKFCFTINMFYNCDPDGKSDYVKNKNVTDTDEFTPTVKNINLEKVTAKDSRGCAIFIYGLPENPVANIKLKDCDFHLSDKLINEIPEMLEDFEMIKNLGIYTNNAKVEFINTTFDGTFEKVML